MGQVLVEAIVARDTHVPDIGKLWEEFMDFHKDVGIWTALL